MSTTTRIRTAIVKGAVPVVMALVAVLGAGERAVRADGDISVEGFIDGEPLADSSSNDPIVIQPDTSATLRADIDNTGDRAVELRRVRLEGRALGVVFVAYDAAIDVTASPGDPIRLEIPLTFFDLGDQATGLLPATLIVYGDDGSAVATQPLTIDVRGDLTSIVGVFAVTVIGLTVLGFVLLARRLATRSLPENRWYRALQFVPVGLGVGLIATIALAVLRIAAPHGTVWFPLLTVPTAIAFVLGYVAPGPIPNEVPDTVDDERHDAGEAVVGFPAPTPGAHDELPAPCLDDPFATRPASIPRPMSGSRA